MSVVWTRLPRYIQHDDVECDEARARAKPFECEITCAYIRYGRPGDQCTREGIIKYTCANQHVLFTVRNAFAEIAFNFGGRIEMEGTPLPGRTLGAL